jgi:hypothetical protein
MKPKAKSARRETLAQRCVRLDGELVAERAEVGVRDEPVDRHPQWLESRVLDYRLPGLFLDALAPVEAAIASAATGVPYVAMRSAMCVDQDHRREVLRAAQAVAAKHPDFFAEHGSELEFFVPLMAVSAAQMEHLLMLVDTEQAGSERPVKPCSAAEALVIGFIVLAPLALLTLILVLKWRKK